MTFRLKNVLLVGVLLGLLPAARAGTRSGQRQPFDVGWKFNPADSPDAQSVSFDDTAWRPVELPHDWSIEGASSATNRTGGEVLGGSGHAPVAPAKLAACPPPLRLAAWG